MLKNQSYDFEELSDTRVVEGQVLGVNSAETDTNHSQLAESHSFESEETTSEHNHFMAYLAEVKKHDRISRDRELALGKRIKTGQELMVSMALDSPADYKEMKWLQAEITRWVEKKRRPNYTENEVMSMIQETVTELADSCPKDNQLTTLSRRLNRIGNKVKAAKDELVTSNLRLVIKIAKNFQNRGLDLPDLVQEGNLGLIKAAGRYDYSKGSRFSTYSSWWIRQAITKAIYDKGRTIRLPVHHLEVRRAFFRTFYELFKELEREPAPIEIAEKMNISLDEVMLIYRHISTPVSLETTMADEETYIKDSIADDAGEISYEKACLKELEKIVRDFVENLSPRQAAVIKNRFGINSEPKLSLCDLGRQLDISSERVRQIEIEALKRLRHPAYRMALENLL